jgi:hypothetical protein
MRPNQGSFNFQLSGMAAFFGPDPFEIIAAVAVIEWTSQDAHETNASGLTSSSFCKK